MASNGRRVYSDCSYASNPYHECAEYCLRRIAEGNVRKDVRKDKKKSGHGSARKDVELNKKYEEKRVHPACIKASNPYHECNDDCFKRIAGAEARGENKETGLNVPIKFIRRKKYESQPKPPHELDNVPAQGTVKKELNPEEHFSSVSYSGEIHVDDPLFKLGQVLFPQLVPRSGILTKPDNPKDTPNEAVDLQSNGPPIDQKKDENHHASNEADPKPITISVGEGTTGSRSFTFTDIAHDLEESDEEDAQSVISDSTVSVGKYRVKEGISSILQSIFDKYGDIAASCKLESISMRSYNLECVCFVVQDLQSTPIKQMTKSKVKEMLAILKDVEGAGIDVGWLRNVLSESIEAIELVSQHRALEVAKANCDHDMESLRNKLESQMEHLALKEKEVVEAKKLVAESKAHLRELELKASVLNETVGSIKSKAENFHSKSLLDGVL
ncbi:hypothetical protein FNV43_RR21810 [Rhamnella rubrinervis]|uniref:Phospholipase-like protein n=1 Tax=Rhamnella rubrinervis TaxID=2594499 RepID=A0A8K0GUJ9_9ROSA|nr:hypothetical protein FNV43_RR21810 [Rhamnella rubrinervis]